MMMMMICSIGGANDVAVLVMSRFTEEHMLMMGMNGMK